MSSSGVDLDEPERLKDARRVLLDAVDVIDEILSQARQGLASLEAQIQQELGARSREIAAFEHQALADIPDRIGRCQDEVDALSARLSSVSRAGSELVATISRAAAELRTAGRDGASFLAGYHARLTGARSSFSTHQVSPAAQGGATGTQVAAASTAGQRSAAINAARAAVRTAFSNAEGVGRLSKAELDALSRYTSDDRVDGWDGRWYEIANALLRGDDPRRRLTLEDLEAFEREGSPTAGLAAALRALKKLPRVEGIFHRGIDTRGWSADSRAAFVAGFTPGSSYRDGGFLSSSTQERVARDFAPGAGVLLHITGRTGRSLEGLSLHSPEHEVVFDPFTTFRVDRLRSDSSGGLRVWLKEID